MTNNPFLKIDQKMVGDVYTSSEVIDNLTVLCDDFGARFAGTPGEKQAAEFIAAKLTEYGLQNVAMEPVEYLGWTRGSVTLEITSPIQKTIDCITLPHSPPADLEAVLCDLDDGGPLSFSEKGANVAGKIAMVNSKTQPRGSSRWVHRNEKYGRAMLADAAGFIFINHYPAYGPATGGIGDNYQGLIPAISVSYEDGSFLQRLIQRKGEVTVRIKSTDSCKPMTSWNIVGEIPGSAADPEVVMLGSHYDGHDISQGAQDPASGTVSVMEAARVLAKYDGELPNTVRFVLWGVEEIGLIGSKAYVKKHAAELDNIRFYYNMDAAGGTRAKDVVLNEWPELVELFEGWQKEMKLDYLVGQSVSAHSDHYPFLLEGVPTGGMSPVARDLSGRGYGHTRYDTLDKVPTRGLREAAAMACRLAFRVATERDWPVSRRSHAEVATLLDRPDYQEEAKIFAEIEAHVKENTL